MYKIALCEDNKAEAEETSHVIQEFFQNECEIISYEKGSLLLGQLSLNCLLFDIVIMDIELDGESGLDIAERIAEMYPYTQIIFLTNYLDYATGAYEINHLYYVHKYKMKEFLPKALSKAVAALTRNEHLFLYISYRKKHYRIPVLEILYLERTLRTTMIYTEHTCFQTSESFASLQQRLPEYFAVCHRSFMVNLNYVVKFSRKELSLNSGKLLTVGSTFYENFKLAYTRYMLSSPSNAVTQ